MKLDHKIRLLHCADLHLGTPFHSLARQLPSEHEQQLRQASTGILGNIVRVAIQEQVDAVCIVGDLFDEADAPVSIQFEVQRQFQALEKAGIPVVIVRGNHDPFGQPPLFHWPDNVTELAAHDTNDASVRDIVLDIGRMSVQFSGFSYPSSELYGSQVSNFTRNTSAELAIGLYHGQVGGGSGHHKSYAATGLVEMAQHRGIDVWLLGHIHQYAVLHERYPLILYSGSPLGRDMSEVGPHGVVLVDIEEGGQASQTFVPVADVEWLDMEVDITGAEDLEAMLVAVRDTCMKEQGTKLKLVQLTLVGSISFYDKLSGDDIRQSIQDAIELDAVPVFIHRLINACTPDLDLDTLKRSDGYIGELLTLFETANVDTGQLIELCEQEWTTEDVTFLREVLGMADGSLEDILRQAKQLVVSSMNASAARA